LSDHFKRRMPGPLLKKKTPSILVREEEAPMHDKRGRLAIILTGSGRNGVSADEDKEACPESKKRGEEVLLRKRRSCSYHRLVRRNRKGIACGGSRGEKRKEISKKKKKGRGAFITSHWQLKLGSVGPF